MKYKVAVIGGGPGGYVAAIRAAQLGMKVCVIEKSHLGGICLNWGCIPTKAILQSAKILIYAKNAAKYGVCVAEAEPDFAAIMSRSRDVVAKLSAGVAALLSKNKIDVIEGCASIACKSKNGFVINVAGRDSVETENVILATGASPVFLTDFKDAWTYRDALCATDIPKSLLVIGAGAIGMEFANFYNALGTAVTVVEMCDRILPAEDSEISDCARKEFEKAGIKIFTGARASRDKTGGVIIDSGGKKTVISPEKILVSVGVRPNSSGIGLESTKAVIESNGRVDVGQFMETSEPGLYAIGDLTNPPYLAHKASHEGVICAEHIAGIDTHPLDLCRIPACTYTFPQIASIGITEEAARKAGHDVRVGKFPFMANGQSIAACATSGFVKTIYDTASGELLGAHMIGESVSELISAFAIAMSCEGTDKTVASTIFPHPSMSEAMHEATLSALGIGLHF